MMHRKYCLSDTYSSLIACHCFDCIAIRRLVRFDCIAIRRLVRLDFTFTVFKELSLWTIVDTRDPHSFHLGIHMQIELSNLSIYCTRNTVLRTHTSDTVYDRKKGGVNFRILLVYELLFCSWSDRSTGYHEAMKHVCSL